MLKSTHLTLALALLLASACSAEKTDTHAGKAPGTAAAKEQQPLETGLLQVTEGYVGGVLGAEVEKITTDAATNTQTIEVSVPIESNKIYRIRLLTESNTVIPQQAPAQIRYSADAQEVNITLHVTQEKTRAFKIRMLQTPGPTSPAAAGIAAPAVQLPPDN